MMTRRRKKKKREIHIRDSVCGSCSENQGNRVARRSFDRQLTFKQLFSTFQANQNFLKKVADQSQQQQQQQEQQKDVDDNDSTYEETFNYKTLKTENSPTWTVYLYVPL